MTTRSQQIFEIYKEEKTLEKTAQACFILKITDTKLTRERIRQIVSKFPDYNSVKEREYEDIVCANCNGIFITLKGSGKKFCGKRCFLLKLNQDRDFALKSLVRTCTKCSATKPSSLFYRKKVRGNLTIMSSCKDCQKKWSSSWRERNKDRIRELMRNAAKKYYEKIKNDPIARVMRRFNYSRKKCIEKGRDFSIDFEFYNRTIKLPCAYCGDASEQERGLDRVVNDIGYTVENCVSCCIICNRMKRDMSVDAFISRCTKIAKIAKKIRK